jgi:hypothetical protein
MRYTPTIGETVFLLYYDSYYDGKPSTKHDDCYHYLSKCPLKVLSIADDIATVEFLPHNPFTATGIYHTKNDMTGFTTTVSTANLCPESLKTAWLFYQKNNNSPFKGLENLNMTEEQHAVILARYKKDYGMEIGKTYRITSNFSRKGENGKWMPVTKIKTVAIKARSNTQHVKYTVVCDGKTYDLDSYQINHFEEVI